MGTLSKYAVSSVLLALCVGLFLPVLITPAQAETEIEPGESGSQGPLSIDETQRSALNQLGIDPTNSLDVKLPSIQSCFASTVTPARLDQIKSGTDTPTLQEFYSARHCLAPILNPVAPRPSLLLGTYGKPGFIPLTNLPGLTADFENRTLADYLNVLYRLAIGIGALIAVIKITLAGVKYMGTDSFSSKEEARKDITSSLLGLLLILSTVVILQLIYGPILNLNAIGNLPKLTSLEKPVASTGVVPVQTGVGTSLNLPNGESCVDPRNCHSGYCKPPVTGPISGENAGTCEAAPTQSGLPQSAECNAGQQSNPCATPLQCRVTITPCDTNVTGFCGRSTCQP